MDNLLQGRTPFGVRLRKARKDKGLTQKQVERLIGIAQSNLAELEVKGTGSGFTVALAVLYGVNPVWLALGKGPQAGGRDCPEWLEVLTEEEKLRVSEFAHELVATRARRTER